PGLLGGAHVVDQRLEPPDLGTAQGPHGLQRLGQLAQLLGLEDQLVLELLRHGLELGLGVGEQRAGLAPGLVLGLEELELRPELLNLGPLEVEVVGLEGLLEALDARSEEHTSELQSREKLVCRLLLEKKKK